MMIEDDQERRENKGNGLRSQLMGNLEVDTSTATATKHLTITGQLVSIRYLTGVATREIQY